MSSAASNPPLIRGYDWNGYPLLETLTAAKRSLKLFTSNVERFAGLPDTQPWLGW
jgi:hypothetical protein